ncbi:sulfotransferase [Dyella monticola]|uniref:sulfotransferase n=1 Tax=Dyella monticola TaxID=1927958 RepID=UPI001313DD24
MKDHFRLKSHRLLCIDICEGWEALCRFLGKKMPSIPFPHIRPEPWSRPHSDMT